MATKVLLVDDLEDWRTSLSGLLTDGGYEVHAVGSKIEALNALKTRHFHVAVLDVRLDETDENNTEGLTLMYEIKEKYSSVAVIILTGYATVKMVQDALQPDNKGNSPAFGFLQKSETDKLTEYVRNASLMPTFKPSQECEITIALEPGQRPTVHGRGDIHFTHISNKSLSPDLGESEGTMSTADRRSLKKTGQELYRLLFEQHSSVINGYHRAVGTRAKKHLHLVFESTRELAKLPLEFLFSEVAGGYLTLLHPLTRRIQKVVTRRESISPEMLRRLVSSGERLRILLLASNTKPRIALIDEIGKQLEELLSPVPWLDLTYVKTEAATYHAVQEMFHECQYHIVHYIGHGNFREDSPEKSSLFFWEGNNMSGSVKPMTGNELRLLLQDSDTRLFHLTCCDGSHSGNASDLLDGDYLGIADSIIQAGVPSVLGYRRTVSAEPAQEMTRSFYHSLLRYGSPELALLDARIKLAAHDMDDLTWASPILIVQNSL